MSKRVSAGAKIETIVEQARKVEAGSTDRLAVVQDLAILCLVGLRQLAEEIDRHHGRLEVMSNSKASSRRTEDPAVESVKLATQFGDRTSQVTKMTKAARKLSKEVERLSMDVKRLSKAAKNLSKNK
jgi:hypothetical protein